MGGTLKTENLLGLDDKPLDGWTLLSTTVASSDATIDITGLSSDYFVYKFIWYAILPATTLQSLHILTSSDNGSNWDVGASDYAWANHRVTMTTVPGHTPTGDDADAQMVVTNTMDTGTDQTADLEITCFNPSGTEYTKFKWEVSGTMNNEGTSNEHIMGAGLRLEAAAAVNGVRFLFASGNITSGQLWVYGIKA